MEIASKLLAKLAGSASAEELARAAWPLAVGKKIAPHAYPIKLVRTRLVVEVEDATWQKQLFVLRHQVVAKLAERLGGGLVEEVEFRVAPRRREPQRAVQAAPQTSTDDAERIVDPVLRSIYKTARKRAASA